MDADLRIRLYEHRTQAIEPNYEILAEIANKRRELSHLLQIKRRNPTNEKQHKEEEQAEQEEELEKVDSSSSSSRVCFLNSQKKESAFEFSAEELEQKILDARALIQHKAWQDMLVLKEQTGIQSLTPADRGFISALLERKILQF